MGLMIGLAALALGCSDKRSKPPPACRGGVSTVSGLPLPKGCVAPPAGDADGNVQVLPWAGFKGAVSFTFDDAVGSQLRNYETLNAPGVRLTFYVSPSQVEREDPDGGELLPRWKQVLADGHEIGSHTVHHCRILSAEGDGTLDVENTSNPCAWGVPEEEVATARLQVEAANDYVRDVIQQVDARGRPAVWTMATPYGDGAYRRFAQEAGLLASRDVWMDGDARTAFLAPGNVDEIFSLPTWAGGGAPWWGVQTDQASFEKIVNDARGRGGWTTLLFHDVTPDPDPGWDPSSYSCCAVRADAIAGALEHLKGWGDVWGDSVVNVAAYTIAQHLFSTLEPVEGAEGARTWTWTLPENYPPGKYLRVSVSGGTLTQAIDGAAVTLPWNPRGFYEVALDAGNLTLTP
jgi:peptidoglycan/xylan/chitin deacetylase (PgdA/CDA1 family)